MTAPRTISDLPLVAIARGVENESRWWFRLDLYLRIFSFALAFLVLIYGTFGSLHHRVAIVVAVTSIGLEVLIQFVIESRANSLQSLARSLLQRELFLNAAQSDEKSVSVISLKNRAEQEFPNASQNAIDWLETRKSMGKSDVGSDFHSTAESNPDDRLLDILYENYSWWSELSRATEARLRRVLIFAGVITLAAIALVSTVDTASVRLPLTLIILQSVLLFGVLRVMQDWRLWNSAAHELDVRRTELSRIRSSSQLEHGEIYGFAIDYSVITRSVPPISMSVLNKTYKAIDQRVQAELSERRQGRISSAQDA